MSISTRLKSLFDENKIPYSVMTHDTTYTGQDAAATMQISGKELAKTVILWASEQEFSNRFLDSEPRAMPPVGSLYNLPVYLMSPWPPTKALVFNAGTYHGAIRMRYDDFVRL